MLQKQIYLALSTCLFTTLTGLSGLTPQVNARPTGGPTQIARKVTFEPPKGQPAPRQTIGGGRRDSGTCAIEQVGTRKTPGEALTALVPKTNLGLTTDAHPTIFAYIPKTSAKSIEFLVEDSEAGDIYQETITLVTTPTIIRLTLPKTSQALEVGKDYRWIVSMNCQPAGPRDPFTGAWIRRINPDASLTAKLSKAKPLEQASIYAAAGIWHEALTTLATLQTDKNATVAWKELLQSVGLEAIATTPVQP